MGQRAKGSWSRVGAARAARDARTATATWLREAAIARAWQAPKIAVQFQAALPGFAEGDIVAPDAFPKWAAAALGYPMPWHPGSWEEVADRVLADQADDLAEAQLYVVSPDMCDVVVAAARSLTRSDLDLLTEADIPSPRGLLFLLHPLMVRSLNGEVTDDRAFMWRVPVPVRGRARGASGWATHDGLRLTIFHDRHGPIQPESFREFAAQAARAGTPLPPLMIDLVGCTQLGPDFHTPTEDRALNVAIADARGIAQRVRQDHHDQGHDEDIVIGEYSPGSEIDDADGTFRLRLLYAFWRLCEQRIAVEHQAEVSHSARVTTQRARVSPDVRVVELRPATSGPTSDTRGHTWNHR